MIDYNKRLVEVDEVLRYLSKENLNKIPEEVRLAIKEYKDKDYVWKYDESKELKDQNISDDAVAILSYLNMEYLLNEEQKELMQQIFDLNEKKAEEEKKKKYDPDNIFKKEDNNTKQMEENLETKELLVFKENIFHKIFNKIKSFFTKK